METEFLSICIFVVFILFYFYFIFETRSHCVASKEFITFLISLLTMCVHMHITQHTCRNRRQIVGVDSLPVCVLETEPRLSGLAASTFVH